MNQKNMNNFWKHCKNQIKAKLDNHDNNAVQFDKLKTYY